MKKQHLLASLSLAFAVGFLSMTHAEAFSLSNGPANPLEGSKCNAEGRCADGTKASCAVQGPFTDCSSGGMLGGPLCIVAKSREAFQKGDYTPVDPCKGS